MALVFQSILQSFLTRTHPKKLLVLCHANADVDSTASALALHFSLPKKSKVTIGVPEHANQFSKALANSLKAKLVLNPVLSNFDAIIAVDFNEPFRVGTMAESLQDYSKPILVIDHHLKGKKTLSTRFVKIVPGAPSTSFLVLQELQQSGFSVPKKACLALAAGMISDSDELLLADSELLEALSGCLEKTRLHVDEIRSLYQVPEDFSEKVAKLKSLHRLQLFELDGFLVAVSHTSFFESQSAMALLASGADLSLVAGLEKKDPLCRLVCRANRSVLKKTGLNLARDVCLQLPSSFGGHGNGHAGAAGFSALDARPELVLQKSLDLLADFFRKKRKNAGLREII